MEALEFEAGVRGGESPVDGGGCRIARPLPGGRFAGEKFPGGHPSAQALAREHAQFNPGHVQPTAVLRRVVDLHAARQPVGFCGRERFVEADAAVGVERVHHPHDLLGRLGDGSFRVRGVSTRPQVSLTRMADWNLCQDQDGYFHRTFSTSVARAFAKENGLSVTQSVLS